MKKEFIKGEKLNGLIYDFKAVNKLYKSLKCPRDVYDPTHLPFNSCKWFITLSERARGKTTNLLLYGMCIYALYGTGICYIRSSESMIVPKQSRDMFSNIISWGYVEKLTRGEFNNIEYKSRRWFFVLIDEKGEVVKSDPNAFCIMLSIDNQEKYKSVLETKNDFIIFDEFIERNYYPQQFIQLCHLLKTILRERLSGLICLCANTIDRLSPYFSELQINETVEQMLQGDSEVITTEKGTNIYVEILGKKAPRADKKQQEFNDLYYGFNNSKLVSITGVQTWDVENYPHTPTNFKIIKKNYYIRFNNKLINLEICKAVSGVSFINCHIATKTYDDSIIYSLAPLLEPNERYMVGYTRIDRFIFDHYKKDRFTYANNAVGALVEKFMIACGLKRG